MQPRAAPAAPVAAPALTATLRARLACPHAPAAAAALTSGPAHAAAAAAAAWKRWRFVMPSGGTGSAASAARSAGALPGVKVAARASGNQAGAASGMLRRILAGPAAASRAGPASICSLLSSRVTISRAGAARAALLGHDARVHARIEHHGHAGRVPCARARAQQLKGEGHAAASAGPPRKTRAGRGAEAASWLMRGSGEQTRAAHTFKLPAS